jgi:hypothetical protein
MQNQQQVQPVGPKIAAFREFASTLAGQVVEQLCVEFEREVSVMYNDLLQYRNELGRVAELLGHQLGRERQLHEMLEQMSNHQTSLAQSAQQAAAQQPQSKELHEMVDRMVGGHSQISTTMLQGMSQSHAVTTNNINAAKALQEPMINAENEFNRIMQLLSQPMISMATPQATMAKIPQIGQPQARMTPPSSPYTGGAMSAPYRQSNGAPTLGNSPVSSPINRNSAARFA